MPDNLFVLPAFIGFNHGLIVNYMELNKKLVNIHILFTSVSLNYAYLNIIWSQFT